jgi:hypothetical protein
MVLFQSMARNSKATKIVLKPGQLWKTNQGYVEIVQLGKTLAHYRRTVKPHQRGAAKLFASMKAVTEMLEEAEGKLMPSPEA